MSESIDRHEPDLSKLALALSMAEARERRRISADLHDHLGQYLALIRMKLSTFQGNTMFMGFEQDLAVIQELLDKAIQYTRHLTMAISPPILYELGLVPAVEWLVDQYRKRHHLDIALTVGQPVPAVQEDLRVIVYQAIRELLINIVKHANTSRAKVTLDFADSDIWVTVADAGCGFDPGALDRSGMKGYGLFSLTERLACLHGKLEIDSAPGRGTRVSLRCPVTMDGLDD